MSGRDDEQQQRAPDADHLVQGEVEEEDLAANSTMYEQNNSSEEELEVIINGQGATVASVEEVPISSSRTTPDGLFSEDEEDEDEEDDEDEDGCVVYEIKAIAPERKLSAVNVTGRETTTTTTTSMEEEEKLGAGAPAAEVTFRRPSTAEKRKRPIDDDDQSEEVCMLYIVYISIAGQWSRCLTVVA